MICNLVEAWQIHHQKNVTLLNALNEEGLNSMAAGSGRSVIEHFIHMHNVRMLWLNLSLPCELIGLIKLKKEDKLTTEELLAQFNASADGVANLLNEAVEEKKKIKGFKSSNAAFLAYIVSHESHHRGQIMMILKSAGKPVDKKTAYKLWEWDRLDD